MAFDKSKLIDLDECVLNALKLFINKGLPELGLEKFKRPLVVGSGNAAVTGKIIFEDKDAVFADEGNYSKKLVSIKEIDGCILLSASGGKHAPLIAKDVKNRNLPVVLLTNNKNALAKEFADETYVFPKNPEPYTYNTSTYLSMILAKTKEKPKEILDFILKLKIPNDFSKYDAYFLIVPEEFDLAREMFLTKFDELFGSKISGRVFTPEQTKHAKTVVPSNTELFISFGYKNELFGTERLNIELPENAGYASIIAIVYYVIGHIQKQSPPYYKDNIEAYTKKASEIFGQEIKPIVE